MGSAWGSGRSRSRLARAFVQEPPSPVRILLRGPPPTEHAHVGHRPGRLPSAHRLHRPASPHARHPPGRSRPARGGDPVREPEPAPQVAGPPRPGFPRRETGPRRPGRLLLRTEHPRRPRPHGAWVRRDRAGGPRPLEPAARHTRPDPHAVAGRPRWHAVPRGRRLRRADPTGPLRIEPDTEQSTPHESFAWPGPATSMFSSRPSSASGGRSTGSTCGNNTPSTTRSPTGSSRPIRARTS